MASEEPMTSEVDWRKRELRTHYRTLREAIGADERMRVDGLIEARVRELPAFARAEVLLTYLDMPCEVRTRGLIEAAWAEGKTVALPWCVPHARELRWFVVTSLADLVRSPFGVEEPVPRDECELLPTELGSRALALVPGLTFDAQGFRLGYGGGYYDHFLAGFAGASVGLCRHAQLADDLRAAGVICAHDLPVELVVTEERVLPASSL